MSFIIIYNTCKDKAEAEKIAELVVKPGLVACANIIEGMNSIYLWQGKLEKSTEVVLLLKTKKENFKAVEKIILQHHSYDCPCIFSVAMDELGEAYGKWLSVIASPQGQ